MNLLGQAGLEQLITLVKANSGGMSESAVQELIAESTRTHFKEGQKLWHFTSHVTPTISYDSSRGINAQHRAATVIFDEEVEEDGIYIATGIASVTDSYGSDGSTLNYQVKESNRLSDKLTPPYYGALKIVRRSGDTWWYDNATDYSTFIFDKDRIADFRRWKIMMPVVIYANDSPFYQEYWANRPKIYTPFNNIYSRKLVLGAYLQVYYYDSDKTAATATGVVSQFRLRKIADLPSSIDAVAANPTDRTIPITDVYDW